MKTTIEFKRFISELTLGIFIVTTLNPVPAIANATGTSTTDKVIYPLKEISKLECRFNEFKDLDSNCKQDLPILYTKDYQKYATLNGGYNDFTRLYTVLWGGSYKYGWDIGNGGHIGTDIATAKGTPVYAVADGIIIKAKNDVMLGNFVTIEHKIKGKKIYSNYAHMSVLNVNVGQSVSVGDKIGEVGSTGNSTGNHLHFQIDLDTTTNHPYYYDYNTCPYSYYKITEEGICFNELTKNTIDPLLFLETSGAVLDNITTISVTPIKINSNISISTNTNTTNSNDDLSIFDRTVYIGYTESDIKKVQEILQKIGIYRGEINGKYEDITETIISYQLTNNIITDRNAEGAGWFGPKTRATLKNDYLKAIAGTNNQTQNLQVVSSSKIETQKIDKKNLMTREEIEKREVEEFLKYHNIELNFLNKGDNIEKGGSETIKLNITDKKGRPFIGEMPGGMTFIVNTEKVSVFPEKLFYFTDGKRDITVTGLATGNTNLYVKIGKETIKTFSLKVYDSKVAIYPTSSKIIAANSTTIGSKQTGIVAFKDTNNKYIINLKYGSTYNIKASGDNKICIKKGTIKNIQKIYKSSCSDSDYKNEYNFTYEDTVGGMLVFDYKATSKNFNLTVKNNYNNQVLSQKSIAVNNPKGLANNYAYKTEVLSMLEQGVVDGVNKGYFLEERGLLEKDAYVWIQNALVKIQSKNNDTQTSSLVANNLNEVKNKVKVASKSKTLTRLEFLNMAYKYLVFDRDDTSKKGYRDIDDETNKKLANIFDENTTWKDQFGQSYFRPVTPITRGEAAFLLKNTLDNNAKTYLTKN